MFERSKTMLRMVTGLARARPTGKTTIAYVFEQQARKHPERPFLYFEEQRFTYGEANVLVNRHAHAYARLGLGTGDTVALIMDNRPAFLWHLLAAGKLGATVSLINTHNTGAPLVHALTICEPRLIAVGGEHAAAFGEIRSELQADVRAFIDMEDAAGEHPEATGESWAKQLVGAGDADPESTSKQSLSSLGAYIYTSGTTGLPKAAKMRNVRMYGLAMTLGGVGWGMRRTDVIYNPLPLYHTSGLAVCTGAVICYGASMVLARRFSASRFWDEVRRHECTGFVYIGELCRYLMNRPRQDNDADNRIRVAVGNGLRPDIWADFQERFDIPRIREFYGSTEGNVGTLNLDGTIGSVGRLMGAGNALVKWDDQADDFARGEGGFLQRCGAGESGVLIGRIASRASAAFDGYQDSAATEQKILRDVFKPGDAYFNTGDMLRMDRRRRLYFVDRMGDTFRWKGENVSTFEVQEQLSGFAPIEQINVYGVEVPHADGRAGMASVVLSAEFDPAAFQRHVDAALPSYARPVFVRVQQGMDTTGTLKLKKTELREEGYDPALVRDPLYFRHPEQNAYVPLSPELHRQIAGGDLRI